MKVSSFVGETSKCTFTFVSMSGSTVKAQGVESSWEGIKVKEQFDQKTSEELIVMDHFNGPLEGSHEPSRYYKRTTDRPTIFAIYLPLQQNQRQQQQPDHDLGENRTATVHQTASL